MDYLNIDLEELVIQLNRQNIDIEFFGDTGVELRDLSNNQHVIGVCRGDSVEGSLATLLRKLVDSKNPVRTRLTLL